MAEHYEAAGNLNHVPRRNVKLPLLTDSIIVYLPVYKPNFSAASFRNFLFISQTVILSCDSVCYREGDVSFGSGSNWRLHFKPQQTG